MFIDYKPFSILGGEVEVLNQLQMGAIQGMLVQLGGLDEPGPAIRAREPSLPHRFL